MSDWRIGWYRGEYAVIWYEGDIRRRYKLGTADKAEAIRRAPSRFAELTRPKTKKVKDLWAGYCNDNAGKPVLDTMEYTWRALKPQFAELDGDRVTIEDCRTHTKRRREAGLSDGTIHTELGHLRTVLVWANRHNLITAAPHIERPPKPPSKDTYLTKEQVSKMLECATAPHIRLAIILLVSTGARSTAALELTWDRVNLDRLLIDLKNPFGSTRVKGRAIVPINRDLLTALQQARLESLSPYVIEYAGRPIKSIRRGLKRTAKKAGITETVSPHVLRHSAAVWMAEAGIPMTEISQFLGHRNSGITERIYARYSPTYLRKAAAALEFT